MKRFAKIILFTGVVVSLSLSSFALSVNLIGSGAEVPGESFAERLSSGASILLQQNRGNQNSASSNEVISTSTIDPTDWNLLLVNPNHSVPDDCHPVLAQVQGSYEMDERVAPYMKEMIDAAKKDGINLWVLSTYRTYEYQQKLFDTNVKQLKSQGMTEEEAVQETAANVAVPGTSEHQTGLAADIMCSEWTGGITDDFAETPAYEWLHAHCAEYGFIERYPKDKTEITGIVYEPWHYRFVGKEHAETIMSRGITLEEYLGVR
ncbi:MAG: M15 family metallopeptidase [Oscillospiraceae bacterium]|nr:M15 family metallopeptidase [Oscillospiraceae bacterium]